MLAQINNELHLGICGWLPRTLWYIQKNGRFGLSMIENRLLTCPWTSVLVSLVVLLHSGDRWLYIGPCLNQLAGWSAAMWQIISEKPLLVEIIAWAFSNDWLCAIQRMYCGTMHAFKASQAKFNSRSNNCENRPWPYPLSKPCTWHYTYHHYIIIVVSR